MFNFFARIIVGLALKLRYRINVRGMNDVINKYGRDGILFLPNHPALIDPVIVSYVLWEKFLPRALVHQHQIDETVLKHLWQKLRILPLPEIEKKGSEVRDVVISQINACIEALKAGDNLLVYPAGRLYRCHLENLRGNGGACHIINNYPNPKVVMVRTTGLWGSDFSRAKGAQIHFGAGVKHGIKCVLANLLFFTPRRQITVELVPAPEDFPFNQDKHTLNRYLEKFYNATATGNTYVPYGWWEKGGTRVLPEPENSETVADINEVAQDIKDAVIAKIREYTDKSDITENTTLGSDLGLDSLVVAELQSWIMDKYGTSVENAELLQTVGSLQKAAAGILSNRQPLQPVDPQWFITDDSPQFMPDGKNIAENFLINAEHYPDRPIYAEQGRGICTNKKAVLAVMVLSRALAKYQDERIGLLMPATMVTTLVYLALVFAGKIPVMLNWTVGNRNMRHCIKNTGLNTIITANALIDKLRAQGVDFSNIEEHFEYLENISADISLFTKISCFIKSKISLGSLKNAKINETAAIIFTSGSENLPKAVPLTHDNIISDLRFALKHMHFRQDISMVGMLPPFHSFGLLLNIAYTASTNIRCVYHPNPTDGEMLARLIAAYQVNFICGTPTFIANILRHGTKEQLQTLQYVVMGAEKCPDATYQLINEKCHDIQIFEGYGITECGPIVSLNTMDDTKIGTIGRPLDCDEAIITDENCTKELGHNETGMLLLRGPNIFHGYLNYDGPSPFIELNGKTWYKTGDLVAIDEDGYIHFKGRLKRFIKLGGEMISLPAIEDALNEKFRNPGQDGPTLAVESQGNDDAPVITLFTTVDISREAANQVLRDAGFSPLQSIRDVVRMEAIPVLGTGKTDYRALRELQH